MFDGVQSGIAIWRNNAQTPKTLMPHCASEITLRDESVPHRCPAQHHDFLVTTVKTKIPPALVNDVLALSGSVNYDGLKQELSARCASLEANVATLHLASQIVSGKKTIAEIHANGLYGEQIAGIGCGNDDNAECNAGVAGRISTMSSEMCTNFATHTPDDLDYYENAFNSSCKSPHEEER